MRQMPHKTYGALQQILPVMTPKRIERFEARVDRSGGSSACHPYDRCSHKQGYGMVQGCDDYKGFSFLAHRVAWALANRAEPGSRTIRHSCDNPPCCNPMHLLAGSQADNSADMVIRGRSLAGIAGHRGVRANAAIFTQDNREEAARLRFIDRLPLAAIATRIGCHRATLGRWMRQV